MSCQSNQILCLARSLLHIWLELNFQTILVNHNFGWAEIDHMHMCHQGSIKTKTSPGCCGRCGQWAQPFFQLKCNHITLTCTGRVWSLKYGLDGTPLFFHQQLRLHRGTKIIVDRWQGTCFYVSQAGTEQSWKRRTLFGEEISPNRLRMEWQDGLNMK